MFPPRHSYHEKRHVMCRFFYKVFAFPIWVYDIPNLECKQHRFSLPFLQHSTYNIYQYNIFSYESIFMTGLSAC